ncbi:hypothetical protein [Prochlorococcus marinus]|nr:hypothetical protein [Prochlorococcus marinus]
MFRILLVYKNKVFLRMMLLSTALFFPDYGSSGVPWDLLLLHFYFFAIAIPFLMIFNAARNSDRENPNRVKDETTRYPDLHPRA